MCYDIAFISNMWLIESISIASLILAYISNVYLI